MICPDCRFDTKVIDSRPYDDSVQRRRECLRCGQRFITMEYRVKPLKRRRTTDG